jgi:phosphatidate cytidylyltransferase
MRERGIGAAILVPIVAVVFLLGQPWLTFGVAALALLAALEASRLLRSAGLQVDAWIIVVGAPLAVLGALIAEPRVGTAATYLVAVIVVAAIAAFRVADVSRGFAAWMATTFGAFYVALLAFVPGILAVAPAVPSTAPLGGILDAGRLWLLLLVLTVWSYDTAAFLTGRAYGRRSFLAHISPSKTWSGVIGGTLAGSIVCALLAWAVGAPPLGGLLLGIVIAMTAQAGDVAESLLKRAAGAKDSGNLVPGHGGILDRIDSFLFAAPVLYVVLAWVQWLGTRAPA